MAQEGLEHAILVWQIVRAVVLEATVTKQVKPGKMTVE
jgi:hypothetical protein